MPPVSKTQATWMMWINVGLFVVSLVLLIWAVWTLVFSREKRLAQQAAITASMSKGAGAVQTYLSEPGTIWVTSAPAQGTAGAAVVTAPARP